MVQPPWKPRGISSVGRASGWQPEGQGFKSPILHFCRIAAKIEHEKAGREQERKESRKHLSYRPPLLRLLRLFLEISPSARTSKGCSAEADCAWPSVNTGHISSRGATVGSLPARPAVSEYQGTASVQRSVAILASVGEAGPHASKVALVATGRRGGRGLPHSTRLFV
jgi:hypothetical protein